MSKGFTIIEIIIAIFILSIAVISVYSAFSVMDILSDDATDRLTATYLSQEGIEIARNIRDTNWLRCLDASCDWNSYLVGTSPDCSNGCEADFTDYPSTEKSLAPFVEDGRYLKISPSGFYYYGECDNTDGRFSENPEFCQTKFKRKTTVVALNDNAIKIISEVFWKAKANLLRSTGDLPPSVKTEEILYNWYQ